MYHNFNCTNNTNNMTTELLNNTFNFNFKECSVIVTKTTDKYIITTTYGSVVFDTLLGYEILCMQTDNAIHDVPIIHCMYKGVYFKFTFDDSLTAAKKLFDLFDEIMEH